MAVMAEAAKKKIRPGTLEVDYERGPGVDHVSIDMWHLPDPMKLNGRLNASANHDVASVTALV
mgnify:CR=1 FL=1